jgi:uncharacterized membrane protein (UPF0127 family)
MRNKLEFTRGRDRVRAGAAAALVVGFVWVAGVAAQAGRTAPQSSGQPALPTTKLNIGLNLITAEVAKDDRSRQMGLMFRQSLAPNHGMLFIFENRSTQCMWMRNTLIALSVAFLDDDGRIVNIENMQPKDETTRHCSRQPARYALEMTQGWFAQRKLGAGDVVRGIPKPQ